MEKVQIFRELIEFFLNAMKAFIHVSFFFSHLKLMFLWPDSAESLILIMDAEFLQGRIRLQKFGY